MLDRRLEDLMACHEFQDCAFACLSLSVQTDTMAPKLRLPRWKDPALQYMLTHGLVDVTADGHVVERPARLSIPTPKTSLMQARPKVATLVSPHYWRSHLYAAKVQSYATLLHYILAIFRYSSAGYCIITGVVFIYVAVYFNFGCAQFPGGINDLGEEETESKYEEHV